jgi:hypothetical protein
MTCCRWPRHHEPSTSDSDQASKGSGSNPEELAASSERCLASHYSHESAGGSHGRNPEASFY